MTEVNRYIPCISVDGHITDTQPNCAADKLNIDLTIQDPNFAAYHLERQAEGRTEVIQVSTRSKVCRAHIDLNVRDEIIVSPNGEIIVPCTLVNLNEEGSAGSVHSLAELFRVGDRVARVFTTPEERRASATAVHRAYKSGQIVLPPSTIINHNGRIDVPCTYTVYEWAPDFVFDRDTVDKMLKGEISREALTRNTLVPRKVDPLIVQPGKLVISAMAGLNIGPYHGVIIEQDTMPGVALNHIASPLMDPYTGCLKNGEGVSEVGYPKVEVFNYGEIPIKDPTVGLYLYDLRVQESLEAANSLTFYV